MGTAGHGGTGGWPSVETLASLDLEFDLLFLVELLEVEFALSRLQRPFDLVLAALLPLLPTFAFAASLRVGHGRDSVSHTRVYR